MRYPTYPEQQARSVVEGYVQIVGATDARLSHEKLQRPVQAGPFERIRYADRLLGRSCLRLSQGDYKAARKPLEAARKELGDVAWKREARWDRAKYVAGSHLMIADMINFRRNASAGRQSQQTLHDQTVQAMHSNRQAMVRATAFEEISHFKGDMNELAIRALITRLGNHPQAMAAPALLHHNSSNQEPEANYDILLVEATGDHAIPHKLQVKSRCLGFCDEPDHPEEAALALEHDRSRYTNDIILVSAHCDLHAHSKRGFSYDENRLPIIDQLLQEGNSPNPNPALQAGLDTLTNWLLWNVTTDENRRGTFDPTAA